MVLFFYKKFLIKTNKYDKRVACICIIILLESFNGDLIMGKIDVYDLDNSIARYIANGIKQYITVNEKATFPTAPDYDFFKNLTKDATLEERVKEWHILLHEISEKFNDIAKDYKATQEEINDAFDALKRVFKRLWI